MSYYYTPPPTRLQVCLYILKWVCVIALVLFVIVKGQEHEDRIDAWRNSLTPAECGMARLDCRGM